MNRPAAGRSSSALAALITLAALTVGHQPCGLAVPADGISTPLPTRVERFDPDLQVCLPQAIRDSFARQLQPWLDQPPAVLAQLRSLQLEMTRATVRRCVSKGLMDSSQASRLEQDLGLVAPSAATGADGATVPPRP